MSTLSVTKSPLFKIVLVGDSNTGKTSILSTFVHGPPKDLSAFSAGYCATMGIEFETRLVNARLPPPPPPLRPQEAFSSSSKAPSSSATTTTTTSSLSPPPPLPPVLSREVLSREVRAQVWDTAGQERFARILLPTYFRRAHGCLLVFSVTDRTSYEQLSSRWSEHIDANSGSSGSGSGSSRLVKVVVGNKVDRLDKRVVTVEEGKSLARAMGCAYFEVSARTGEGVNEAFQSLVDSVFQAELKKEREEKGKSGYEQDRTVSLFSKKKKNTSNTSARYEGDCNSNCFC